MPRIRDGHRPVLTMLERRLAGGRARGYHPPAMTEDLRRSTDGTAPTPIGALAWQRLVDLAGAGLHPPQLARPRSSVDRALLSRAYTHCTAVTARNSRSFYVASSLLPSGRRRAVRALYAFCRVTDDLVDTNTGHRVSEHLASWRRRALEDDPPSDDLVATAWADTLARHRIPLCYPHQLLDGVARDLHQKRYQSFDELAGYCYGVASTVGLMSMHIIGFAGAAAIPYAIKLGIALQLTNILRDVGEDWRNGRVYLPQDELLAFGVTEADLAAGQVTDRWRSFMRFQIARARAFYVEALPGVELVHRSGQHATAAAATIYAAILQNIETNDYDVFQRRAYVRGAQKLRHLLHTWWSIHRSALANKLSRHPRQPQFVSSLRPLLDIDKERSW